jgi:predicted nucleotidyltransferase
MFLDALASRPKLRLLRYLATHQGSLTGRALAQAAGVEAKRAAEALRDLVEAGLIQRRRAGRAFLYSMNRNSYVSSDILLPAFERERDWLKQLGKEIRLSVPGIDSVILYGSWARNEARPESDIDLLVVTGRKKDRDRKRALQDRLDDTRGRMAERYGKPVSLLVLDRDEVRRRLRKRNVLLREIIAQGEVIAGSSLVEIFGRE